MTTFFAGCRYADAVVKTFATATVTVNLVIFSALYGLAQPSIVAWCGVVVVRLVPCSMPAIPNHKLVALHCTAGHHGDVDLFT